MSFLKKAFDFYLNSSIHVGLAVWCLVKLTNYEASDYALLVFFGTIVGYNFLKYSEWFLSNKGLRFNIVGIISVTLIASGGFLLLFLKQEFKVQWSLIVALGLVIVYPFFRKIGWLKPFFVSCVVSYITVLIPSKTVENINWYYIQRLLLLSSVMIPFEILDSTTDSVSMKTLPHLFGIPRTKQIGYGLVVLFIIVSLLLTDNLYFYSIFAFSSIVAIYFSIEKRSWYYTSFWVESLPIIWWLISIVFQ